MFDAVRQTRGGGTRLRRQTVRTIGRTRSGESAGIDPGPTQGWRILSWRPPIPGNGWSTCGRAMCGLRVPADDSTRRTLDQMATFLSPRDIVDSGGNSDDKDPLRRAAALARHGIRCVGASVSRWYPGSGKRPCPEGG